MKKPLKRILAKTLFKKEFRAFKHSKENSKLAAETNFRIRSRLKETSGQPIKVLFICHEPTLWGMFESIYSAMQESAVFDPIIVSLPYKHSSKRNNLYKDGGVVDALEERGIEVSKGFDEKTQSWSSPEEFAPDYVFFQTPYELFHKSWSIDFISQIARVCYIPYGTTLFSGSVEYIVNPEHFMSKVHLFFKESAHTKKLFVELFSGKSWLSKARMAVTGNPKLDYLNIGTSKHTGSWKRAGKENIVRILWTPRWNTQDECCHFFEYIAYFDEFSEKNPAIDFTFRPHPLAFGNFLKTGELSEDRLAEIKQHYSESPNQLLDESPDYRSTFAGCDILISDVSSMMLEFFATGKPVIYTHRKNVFNDFGQKLSEGFYWVKDQQELDQTLKRLLAGEDPLKDKRSRLLKDLLHLPEKGAAGEILGALKNDFEQAQRKVS